MKRIQIAKAPVNEPVKIEGFLEHIRNTRHMAFLVLRDSSGSLQATIEKSQHPEWTALLDTLTAESVVSIEGVIQENPQVKLNGRELIPARLDVLSLAAPLPLTKEANIDTRLDYRWLDLRGEKERLLFQVQTCLVGAMREFLLQRDFLELHTPKLIAAASESGADVFEVGYFDRSAYLTQSGQLYGEAAAVA
ncbi:MAG: aspartate--tRNA(Asn) ligase, partial [Alphaproteobacteria bacterium]|nr:aspartate--tRNA(Asn) ligase [Alphaproteobacteria bacterium]